MRQRVDLPPRRPRHRSSKWPHTPSCGSPLYGGPAQSCGCSGTAPVLVGLAVADVHCYGLADATVGQAAAQCADAFVFSGDHEILLRRIVANSYTHRIMAVILNLSARNFHAPTARRRIRVGAGKRAIGARERLPCHLAPIIPAGLGDILFWEWTCPQPWTTRGWKIQLHRTAAWPGLPANR